MSRGLTAGEITVLEGDNYIVEDCIKIVITGGPTYRFTTGKVETTLVDGTYIPESYVSTITNSIESFELRPAELTITFSTFDNSFLNNIITDNYLAHNVTFFKVFKDISSFTVDGVFTIFEGTVTGLDTITNSQTQNLNVRCTSNFYAFSRVRSRKVGDIGGSPPGKTIYWGDLYR